MRGKITGSLYHFYGKKKKMLNLILNSVFKHINTKLTK